MLHLLRLLPRVVVIMMVYIEIQGKFPHTLPIRLYCNLVALARSMYMVPLSGCRAAPFSATKGLSLPAFLHPLWGVFYHRLALLLLQIHNLISRHITMNLNNNFNYAFIKCTCRIAKILTVPMIAYYYNMHARTHARTHAHTHTYIVLD